MPMRKIRDEDDPKSRFTQYLAQRHGTYKTLETGQKTAKTLEEKLPMPKRSETMDERWLPNVALNVIEDRQTQVMILNVPTAARCPACRGRRDRNYCDDR